MPHLSDIIERIDAGSWLDAFAEPDEEDQEDIEGLDEFEEFEPEEKRTYH